MPANWTRIPLAKGYSETGIAIWRTIEFGNIRELRSRVWNRTRGFARGRRASVAHPIEGNKVDSLFQRNLPKSI